MISAILTLPLVALAQVASPPPLPPLAETPVERVFLPFPVPSPPPPPGTELYAQQQASAARRLREECYSEAAIKLIMDHQEQMRTVPPEWRAASRAAQTEQAQAAYAMPLDIARLQRAIEARARLEAEDQARRDEGRIALLRSLPPPDQAIYARGFSTLRPSPPEPVRICPG